MTPAAFRLLQRIQLAAVLAILSGAAWIIWRGAPLVARALF